MSGEVRTYYGNPATTMDPDAQRLGSISSLNSGSGYTQNIDSFARDPQTGVVRPIASGSTYRPSTGAEPGLPNGGTGMGTGLEGMPSYNSIMESNWANPDGAYFAPHPFQLGNLADDPRFRDVFNLNSGQRNHLNAQTRPLNADAGRAEDWTQWARQGFNRNFNRAFNNSPVLERLAGIGLGSSPTATELFGQQQQEEAMKNIATQTAAAMGGTYNPALARAGIMGQAQAGTDIAARLAPQEMQERMAALDAVNRSNQMAATLSQQQQGIANQIGSQLLQNQIGIGNFREGLRQGLRGDNQQLWDNIINRESLQAGVAPSQAAAAAQRDASSRAMTGNIVQGGMGAMGSLMMALPFLFKSDERAKENVKDGANDVREFLRTLKPHKYEYKKEHRKSPLAGDGEHVSVMAQELEKTGIGKKMVLDTPTGKVVNYAKGMPAMLAALADINSRLDAYEGRK